MSLYPEATRTTYVAALTIIMCASMIWLLRP
jgi:hypothetical protein